MRMSLRLILSLVAAVARVSVAFALYQVQGEDRSRRSELEKRAQVLAESLQETIQPLLANGSKENLQRIVERFGNRERLAGLAIYDDQGHPVVTTSNLAARLGPVLPPLNKAVFRGTGHGNFVQVGENKMHVYAVPLRRDQQTLWALAVFHDASYIDAQNTKIWRDTFKHVLIQMLLMSGITLLIVRSSMDRPINRMPQC